jgi:hypothetical protein
VVIRVVCSALRLGHQNGNSLCFFFLRLLDETFSSSCLLLEEDSAAFVLPDASAGPAAEASGGCDGWISFTWDGGGKGAPVESGTFGVSSGTELFSGWAGAELSTGTWAALEAGDESVPLAVELAVPPPELSVPALASEWGTSSLGGGAPLLTVSTETLLSPAPELLPVKARVADWTTSVALIG